MSEYIEIEPELDDDGRTIVFHTNLSLTSDYRVERYEDPTALAEGSPVAKTLAGIDGIAAVEIAGDVLLITCNSVADWHAVAADVSSALKDFFL